MSSENIYLPKLGLVEERIKETPKIETLTISLENGETLRPIPGQFVEMTIFGQGEFPISIANVLDTKANKFQVTVQKIGSVTKKIEELNKGSKIGIRGPFGNGFPMEELKGKDIYLVAGGIGLSGLRLLIENLVSEKDNFGQLKLFYGAKTPKDLIYENTYLLDKEKGVETLLAVEKPDRNWDGHVGLVTELFHKTEFNPKNGIVVFCGPSAMMHYAAESLMKRGFEKDQLLLSMERRMQCGMGMCGHCMLGEKRVCLDGPIFNYDEIRDALEKVF